MCSKFFVIIILFALEPVLSIDLCNIDEKIALYQYKNESWKNCNNCFERKLCIRKCCGVGFHLNKTTCVRNDKTDTNLQIELHNEEKFIRNHQIDSANGLLVGIMDCHQRYSLVPSSKISHDEFFIQENGSMLFFDRYYSNDEFCLDSSSLYPLIALVCQLEDEIESAEKENLVNTIHTAGMILSIPFLLATFIVYWLLPHKTLLMKSLMSYVFNLIFGYILLIVLKYPNGTVNCTAIGFVCIFFLVASFYWMNVICIDTWYSFSAYRGCSVKLTENERFVIYCVYAWGMTILQLSISIALNTNSTSLDWYYPGVGDGQCFFRYGYAELLYFYGPVGVLIAINIALFLVTACKIWIFNRNISKQIKAGPKDPITDDDKQTFVLYLQLVFAMGLNWSLEILSWAIKWKVGSAPDYIWYFTDFLNAIYGVFIFFIFVFKKNVWKLLVKRYESCVHKEQEFEESMTATRVPEEVLPHEFLAGIGSTRM